MSVDPFKKSYVTDRSEVVEVELLVPVAEDACCVLLSLENDCARMSPLDAYKVGMLLLEASRRAGAPASGVSVGSRWTHRKSGRAVEVTAVSAGHATNLTFKTVGKKTFERRSVKVFLEQFESATKGEEK
jgi:hypothetical protein